jgi:hypothetical protein
VLLDSQCDQGPTIQGLQIEDDTRDANELIKHAPKIAKATTVVAAAVPFTAIVKRMLGPAADELGQRFGDRVRLYRYGRSLDMLKKAEKMATEAGFTPKAVPIKLLFPLLEGASFEENETLHDMWAALLANAASPENPDIVRPGFIAILRQLVADEAALLNCIFDQVTKAMPQTDFDEPLAESALLDSHAALGFGIIERSLDGSVKSTRSNAWQFGTCLNSLEAALLLRRTMT